MGITQEEAAERVGCDPWYFRKIERGARLPGRRVALAILSSFGVDVAAWDRAPVARRRAA